MNIRLNAKCSYLILLVCLSTVQVRAQEIGFVEDFALASDREKALQSLVPGTDEFYYFTALHYQNTEQFDRVDALLGEWTQRHGETQRVTIIRNRQALLTYASDPQSSLEYLKTRLQLTFAQQRELPEAERNLPNKLPVDLISYDNLTRRALQQNLTDGFEDVALARLAEGDIDDAHLRHLLQRLKRPDLAGLPALIARELALRDSGGFGSMEIHAALTRDQLDELRSLRPQLENESNYVQVYLSKLQPNADEQLATDPEAQIRYLDRLWGYAKNLNESHNSLKAGILYRRLETDRRQGVHDKARFIEYLKLPRQVYYVNPEYLQRVVNAQQWVNFQADYSAWTRLPPIGNDEPLVRYYLHYYLKDAADTKEFEPYIETNYLRRQFAEVKITAGLGDRQTWASWLSPEEYRQLMTRVDIDFAWTNPTQFGVDEPVTIHVWTKNVETLIVKIFEINTGNFYRLNQREIDSDIKLDGLVPHFERTLHYDEPSQLRVEREFEFPELDHRGVYVIDFIGNGHSSRALVRKGQLHHVVETTIAGQAFTLLDEQHRPVAGGRVWIDGQEFTANESGRVIVPFSTQPGPQPVILGVGDFSSLASFVHEGESYALTAGMMVDRESLIRNRTAAVAVRAGLTLNGIPIPLKLLKEVKLQVSATDLEGLVTTREFSDLTLSDAEETIRTFQVPPRLRQIDFRLNGKVDLISRSEPQSVTASETYRVNEIDSTDGIRDVYLVRSAEGYSLEVRGKTGEVRAKQAVQVVLKHRYFRRPIDVTLQTGEDGRILLGELPEIVTLTATLSGIPTRAWTLPRNETTNYASVNAAVGDAIRLSHALGLVQSKEPVSLLEVRGQTFVADWTKNVQLKPHEIEIEGLPRGDYSLRIKESDEVFTIRVAEVDANAAAAAPSIPQQFVNPFVFGANRLLEVKTAEPIRVTETTVNSQAIRVQLAGDLRNARIHVIARRYLTPFDNWSVLAEVRDAEPAFGEFGYTETTYVTGRDIGDEYRYILDRKYAPKYPGNMLPRPSLLLNPWAIQTTQNGVQIAQLGDEYFAQGGGGRGGQGRGSTAATGPSEYADPSSLDFLGQSAVALFNLRPDDSGMVSIDRGALGDKQQIEVLIVAPTQTLSVEMFLPELDVRALDLRLAHGFDPERHFAQQKQATVLPAKKEFVLEDATASKLQQYDDLRDVYRLFISLTQDPTLAEFGFVLDWPQKTAAEKQELYSKYACHELNFFLLKKDPEFFAAVVRPYLQNKLDRTFVDQWLLQESSLERFADPWQFQRLNVAEEILMSQWSTQHRESIQRHVREQYELQPTDRVAFDRLFDAAVKGDALNEASAGAKVRAFGGLEMQAPAPSSEARPGASSGGVELRSEAAAAFDRRARKADQDELKKLSESKNQAGEPARDAGIAESLREGNRQQLAQQKGKSIADAKDKSGEIEDLALEKAEAERLGILEETRALQRQLYRRIPPTQEWVENQYYHVALANQNPNLIPINRFWRDYAQHDPAEKFLSPYFPEAARSFSEMMFALAVLDLPLQATDYPFEIAENRLTLTPQSDAIAFYEMVSPAVLDERGSNVLISENFFRVDDRYRLVGQQRLDKFITDEFLTHVLYGGQVVLTNPTSTPHAIDLLIQIPAGSMPANGTQVTRTIQLGLQPFSTQTFEYYFYFPHSGQFTHFPSHVSLEQRVVAVAPKLAFNVVDQPSQVDQSSWAYISQQGTDEQVLEFLQRENILQLDLSKVAFRARDAEFFKRLIPLLRNRLAYDSTLWSFGIYHNQAETIREYLTHAEEFLRTCGAALNSPLVVLDPIDRRWYEHREYWPLANARAHQLGRRRQINNPTIFQQYHQLLEVLCCERDFTPDQRLELTYYLLLQDRVEEALAQYEKIESSSVSEKLQYDYLTSYVSLYKEELDRAKEIATRHAAYPVARWQKLFQTVASQINEARGGAPDPSDPANREQRQAELAAQQPGFEFNVESRKLDLHYQNVSQVTVNYYLMDIELLFSGNPFVQQQSGGFSMIRPNSSQVVDLPADQQQFQLELPAAYHNANVLVEVAAAGIVKSMPYYAHAMNVRINENYGQLQVVHQTDAKPMPKVYVKVYVRKNNGQIDFYKDGYTDIRGRFDYVSLSNQSLDDVNRFALLIYTDDNGAIVREAGVPKE